MPCNYSITWSNCKVGRRVIDQQFAKRDRFVLWILANFHANSAAARGQLIGLDVAEQQLVRDEGVSFRWSERSQFLVGVDSWRTNYPLRIP
jgi:hypothetical protein